MDVCKPLAGTIITLYEDGCLTKKLLSDIMEQYRGLSIAGYSGCRTSGDLSVEDIICHIMEPMKLDELGPCPATPEFLDLDKTELYNKWMNKKMGLCQEIMRDHWQIDWQRELKVVHILLDYPETYYSPEIIRVTAKDGTDRKTIQQLLRTGFSNLPMDDRLSRMYAGIEHLKGNCDCIVEHDQIDMAIDVMEGDIELKAEHNIDNLVDKLHKSSRDVPVLQVSKDVSISGVATPGGRLTAHLHNCAEYPGISIRCDDIEVARVEFDTENCVIRTLSYSDDDMERCLDYGEPGIVVYQPKKQPDDGSDINE